jgi:hypothetical protein
MEGGMADEGLTAHGVVCVEHLNQARTLGTSIAAYARSHGLKARMLHDAEQQLKKKGMIADRVSSARRSRSSSEGKPEDSASGFVSVRIDRPSARPFPSLPVLRVRHVRGHVLEFWAWPPAEVLAAVLSGGSDAAA